MGKFRASNVKGIRLKCSNFSAATTDGVGASAVGVAGADGVDGVDGAGEECGERNRAVSLPTKRSLHVFQARWLHHQLFNRLLPQMMYFRIYDLPSSLTSPATSTCLSDRMLSHAVSFSLDKVFYVFRTFHEIRIGFLGPRPIFEKMITAIDIGITFFSLKKNPPCPSTSKNPEN